MGLGQPQEIIQCSGASNSGISGSATISEPEYRQRRLTAVLFRNAAAHGREQGL